MRNGYEKEFRERILVIHYIHINTYYGRIQTTLKEQDIIKQHESKEQLHKTTWRETRMFHNLTYNREIISKVEISSTTMVIINF